MFTRVQNSSDGLLLENFLKADLEKELLTVKDVLAKNGVDYDTVKPITTLDTFADLMPKQVTKPTTLALEEKIIEIEKRTGYYPTMVMEQNSTVHVYYDTISQTSKELQDEVISVIRVVGELFFDKDRVILTLNKMHDYTGTLGPVESEIITVVFKMEDMSKFETKAGLWNKLSFFKRAINDKYLNNKVPIVWRLVP